MMRGLSAFSGSLLVACAYEVGVVSDSCPSPPYDIPPLLLLPLQIMLELGFSHKSAVLAGLFIVFGESFSCCQGNPECTQALQTSWEWKHLGFFVCVSLLQD